MPGLLIAIALLGADAELPPANVTTAVQAALGGVGLLVLRYVWNKSARARSFIVTAIDVLSEILGILDAVANSPAVPENLRLRCASLRTRIRAILGQSPPGVMAQLPIGQLGASTTQEGKP